MKFIREHIGIKLFWFLMALHILNLSVDPPDIHPEYIPEDLSYNDMESIVEIVLEQILGFENAIPEQDDDDSSKSSLVNTSVQLVYLCQQNGMAFMNDKGDIALLHNHFFYRDSFAEQFRPEIVPPPPKV